MWSGLAWPGRWNSSILPRQVGQVGCMGLMCDRAAGWHGILIVCLLCQSVVMYWKIGAYRCAGIGCRPSGF